MYDSFSKFLIVYFKSLSHKTYSADLLHAINQNAGHEDSLLISRHLELQIQTFGSSLTGKSAVMVPLHCLSLTDGTGACEVNCPYG